MGKGEDLCHRDSIFSCYMEEAEEACGGDRWMVGDRGNRGKEAGRDRREKTGGTERGGAGWDWMER